MSKNREAWLTQAVKELQTMFPVLKSKEPIAISCGWPSRSSLSTKKQRIGECWYARCSDLKRHELFISPILHDPIQVLETVVHELVHPIAGAKAGHRAPFKRIAVDVGLTGPMTATTAGPELTKRLNTLSKKLGKYPHGKITASPSLKKQSTRLLKAECPSCGYVVRITQKWVDYGLPTCPCGEEFQQA